MRRTLFIQSNFEHQDGPQQRLHDVGVELVARLAAQLLGRLLWSERGAVWAVAGHRLVGVGHGEDRASSGTSPAARPSGYPRPSGRSWWNRIHRRMSSYSVVSTMRAPTAGGRAPRPTPRRSAARAWPAPSRAEPRGRRRAGSPRAVRAPRPRVAGRARGPSARRSGRRAGSAWRCRCRARRAPRRVDERRQLDVPSLRATRAVGDEHARAPRRSRSPSGCGRGAWRRRAPGRPHAAAPSADCPWSGKVEMPKLIVSDESPAAARRSRVGCARRACRPPCSSESGASIANSSPPTRAALSNAALRGANRPCRRAPGRHRRRHRP